jgi:hypothetical protein
MNAPIRSITGATPPSITASATHAPPPQQRAPALDRASLVADAQQLGIRPSKRTARWSSCC